MVAKNKKFCEKSFSQASHNLVDEYAQTRFQENAKALLDFSITGDEYKLRTIDDLTDENSRLMENVTKLSKSLNGKLVNIFFENK